jgi:hypothetical protein
VEGRKREKWQEKRWLPHLILGCTLSVGM